MYAVIIEGRLYGQARGLAGHLSLFLPKKCDMTYIQGNREGQIKKESDPHHLPPCQVSTSAAALPDLYERGALFCLFEIVVDLKTL